MMMRESYTQLYLVKYYHINQILYINKYKMRIPPTDETQIKHYGKYIVLKENAQNIPIFVLGPHWPIAIITFVVTVAALVALLFYIKSLDNFIWFLIVAIATFIYIIAYLKIILSSPGFAQPISNNMIDRRHPKFCNMCTTLQVKGVVHCDQCEVCIDGFDHHCPWTGKCIGKNNLTDFYFFIAMIFISLTIGMIALISLSSNMNSTI